MARYIIKKAVPSILALVLLCSLLTAAAPVLRSYSDVVSGSWYEGYVTELSGKAIISGYPDGTFRPAGPVTAGEALKLVMLAAGYSEQPATAEHWSGGYAGLAVADGLLTKADIPDLNAPMARLGVARLAAKAMGLTGSGAESPFADVTDGCVTALFSNGVLEGSTENDVLVFRPDDTVSRAEMSAIVSRMLAASDGLGPGYIRFSKQAVPVMGGVSKNALSASAFSIDENGFARYSADGVTALTGVDVSSYQGTIDWARVRAAGIDFAMLRAGGRGYGSGEIYDDTMFANNLRGALAAGLKVGVYFFSQAVTEEEAVEEADHVLALIRGYDVSFPVVFDWENIGGTDARTYGLDTDAVCLCANAFCARVAEAGYSPMIYFNQYLGYVKYDLSRVMAYDFWYAEYNTAAPTFRYGFDMWQYSSHGYVDGIEGRVDLNLRFMQGVEA